MTDLPHDLVRTLLTVVDEGTFDAAAAALYVTPSAVSQRVKALEQRTGRVLLVRTKPVRPTESGQVIVRLARRLAALEDGARRELGIAAGSGPARLPIAVNADSLATWLLPALTRVPQDGQVCVELHREDEAHTAALLREGRVMAAVTSLAEPVAGCAVRPLGLARYLAVASPGFAARHLSDGPVADRLPDAPVIIFDRRDETQDRFVRALAPERAGAGPHRNYVPSTEGFCAMVVAGHGWGLVPASQAEPLLRSGALTQLAPERPWDVPLYWQQWKLEVPALSLVADAITATAAELLLPPVPRSFTGPA
ncbi:LysR family transcriptional regulator ArgP [Streptomyces sodiiphilus]|uniref:LysR family transcriptional regulator ArgP n=1 Tax=Streptomyces sodiiphilus TaxID=226217 RepID=A0ABN2P0I6_9ACTN